jgi:uncharacterized protein (DUF1330 family)
MAAYLIAEVTVTNLEQMVQYREWSSKAIAEHGAEVLARGSDIESLEGEWKPDRIVILKFKDMAAVRAYYDSETYTQARKVREGAGTIRILAVDGVKP